MRYISVGPYISCSLSSVLATRGIDDVVTGERKMAVNTHDWRLETVLAINVDLERRSLIRRRQHSCFGALI